MQMNFRPHESSRLMSPTSNSLVREGLLLTGECCQLLKLLELLDLRTHTSNSQKNCDSFSGSSHSVELVLE